MELEAELTMWRERYRNIEEWKNELTEEIHSYEDGGD